MGYREDKQARKDHYLKYVHGWKLRTCTACNGSGKYDDGRSRSNCSGTGNERYKPTPEKGG